MFVNLGLGLGLKDYVTDKHESLKCGWLLEYYSDRISFSVLKMCVFINMVRGRNSAGLTWDN